MQRLSTSLTIKKYKLELCKSNIFMCKIKNIKNDNIPPILLMEHTVYNNL